MHVSLTVGRTRKSSANCGEENKNAAVGSELAQNFNLYAKECNTSCNRNLLRAREKFLKSLLMTAFSDNELSFAIYKSCHGARLGRAHK